MTLYIREDNEKILTGNRYCGRHDINAPTELAEEYYQIVEAPEKELVWFEHSGHGPWMNEAEKFVDETVRVFSNK